MDALALSGTRHTFPVFSSLLRHAASPALRAADCAAVARVAARQARALGPAHAAPALAAALQELPRVYAAQAQRGDGGGGDGSSSSSSSSASSVSSADSDDGAGSDDDGRGGGRAATTDAGTDAGDAAAVGEPLEQLWAAALALARQLGCAVGGPGELSEVLALALRGAGDDAAAGNAAAALAAAQMADAAAGAWAAGSEDPAAAAVVRAGSPVPPDASPSATAAAAARGALPGGVLPPALVTAAIAAARAPGARWPVLRVLASLLPSAPHGVRSDKQAAALASVACAALAAQGEGAWDGAAPADVAATDRLLRACLGGAGADASVGGGIGTGGGAGAGGAGGAGARPETQLQVARWLLHAARAWGASGGYAAAGGGDACRAAAVLQVASAAARQLAAAGGDAAGAPQLPQLPLVLPAGASALSATPAGLVARAPAFDAAAAPACAAALEALERRQPPLAWAQAARDALARSPGLVAEFGEERLAAALDRAPADEEPLEAASGGADAKQP